MSVEIERKWRVRRAPAALPEGQSIRQGYLAVGTDEVRVRQKGTGFVLTVKQGGGIERQEHEVTLTSAQFDALWPATEGRRIEKRRHAMPLDALTVELDVFEGALAGLMVAEVEFSDRAAAAAFAPPPWFDEELTGVPGWTNAHLALQGMPTPVNDTQKMRAEDLPVHTRD